MHLEADVTKLCRVTNWRAETSLAHGLSKTVDWYEKALLNGSLAA